DPFIGSGTTAVAALMNSRRFVGYDTDKGYIKIAERRVNEILEDKKQQKMGRYLQSSPRQNEREI
ncbi:MAG TPA: DNA methyltransferase, partial [Candidatus Nanoarchaeia archaeon]|nr:DNA methyltransferase [Candidatus Nanoarchaeia archaeon]